MEAAVTASSADYSAYHYDADDISVEELARRQGVRPIKSVDDLARDNIFRTDEELEEFLAVVHALRHPEEQ